MISLNDRKWHPVPIVSLFDRFEPGKGKGLNHLEQVKQGIPYIGATNRNNGVLCFVRDTNISRKMVQEGNCIGFIKNGDGSAGYAIYKQESFISTTDVIYGYAKWLNRYTGLFFVAAQDMIENKYSHGYKRNAQHLKGDRVMLPVTDEGVPDFQFMEDYTKELIERKKSQYKAFLKNVEEVNISSFKYKEWKDFSILEVFDEIQRGKRLKKADHIEGIVPYVSSTSLNNGVDDFIIDTDGTRVFSNCISLANSGSVGTAFFEPFRFVASDHITHLKSKNANMYVYLFLISVLEKQKTNFNFNREINDQRIKRMRIMLPISKKNEPDYEFMEQYGKMLVAKKYQQYLDYLES
jgi:hypothetical protein